MTDYLPAVMAMLGQAQNRYADPLPGAVSTQNSASGCRPTTRPSWTRTLPSSSTATYT